MECNHSLWLALDTGQHHDCWPSNGGEGRGGWSWESGFHTNIIPGLVGSHWMGLLSALRRVYEQTWFIVSLDTVCPKDIVKDRLERLLQGL